jgi:tetratricopeptide (TPR) repeat protein
MCMELSYEQLQKGQQANRFVFHQRYARQELQPYEGEKAFLSFESEQEEDKADLVEASELARLLIAHHIPIAILNACQSGKQIGERETSLGSHLVQAGVQFVLAMGYSVTVSAAELLMKTLYEKLFAHAELPVAIRDGRAELYNHKERRAYFDQQIDLEDWLLPVSYQNATVPLRPREFTLEERTAWFERKAEEARYRPPAPTYGFVGRDLDILSIERRLLTKRNLLLIRGMGGAGKTTLLRHLGAWWHTTGFIQRVFYFGYDEKTWTLQQLMTDIAQQLYGPRYYTDFQPLSPKAQQAMLTQDLRGNNHLLILDNLESITGAHLAIQHTLPENEQASLHSFLTDLARGHTLVLLGSRSGEDWLAKGTFDDNVYDLGGLDDEAASTLADRILERNNATQYRKDEQEQENLKKLIRVLDGFPLALEVVLANLAQQAPAEVLEAMRAGDVSLDIDKSKQQGKNIFEQKTESILRCIDYSHSNLSPEAQQLLLCLAPFTSVFDTNQAVVNSYTSHLKQQPVLASLPFERWPEVIREAQNWGLLSPDPAIPRFLRLQPIFPYFLRNRLHEPEQAEAKSAIEMAFRQHYDQIGGMLFLLLESKDPQEWQLGQTLTSLEYENLMTALNLALETQVSIYNLYFALSDYLDAIQNQQSGQVLDRTVLNQLETYTTDKRTGSLSGELIRIFGTIATRQGKLKQYTKAEAAYQEVLKVTAQIEHIDEKERIKIIAITYHNLGNVAGEQQQWQQAEQYYQQALQIYIEYNDRYAQASTYRQLGIVAQKQGQWQQAEQYYQQALQIYIEYNDRYAQASTYHQLGIVAQKQGQWQQAEQYYQQALQIEIEYNDRYAQASTYHQLGTVAQEQRQWQQAEQYYQQALQIEIEYNDRYHQAGTFHNLGAVAGEQRQWKEARGYFLKAQEIFVEYKDTYSGAVVLQSLAQLWKASNDASLPAAVANILEASVEETEALLREVLGDKLGEPGQ